MKIFEPINYSVNFFSSQTIQNDKKEFFEPNYESDEQRDFRVKKHNYQRTFSSQKLMFKRDFRVKKLFLSRKQNPKFSNHSN